MQLNLKTFDQLVQDMGAALQASAISLIDISVGSVLRAIFEANAAVVLWLQWLVLQVLTMTRAATSTGSDLDSWMADFGLVRLPATSSTGLVSFSRFASNLPASIPVGTIVKTADGLLTFAVTEDPTVSIWQPTSSTYLIPAGIGSANVPAICQSAGSAGNVLAGTITVIASSLPGVDQVNNSGPFVDGVDLETDQAFRVRFQSYLGSLTRATLAAIEAAIAGVQQGLIYLVKENCLPDGTQQTGSFLVIVDDCSGYPPATLISQVASAVDLVRPVGTSFSVIPPIVQLATISLAVTTSSSQTANYVPLIQAQISLYLNSLGVECGASLTRIANAAYAAAAGIENVTNVMINGVATDLSPAAATVVKAGPIQVTLNGG
jgi:uncharacterized phage protein gp47/JayE